MKQYIKNLHKKILHILNSNTLDEAYHKLISIWPEKYNIDPSDIKEDELFNKKIFKRSKGSLKLLNVGELEKPINLQVSYASKTAIEAIEKFGGKIKLTKK